MLVGIFARFPTPLAPGRVQDLHNSYSGKGLNPFELFFVTNSHSMLTGKGALYIVQMVLKFTETQTQFGKISCSTTAAARDGNAKHKPHDEPLYLWRTTPHARIFDSVR